MSVCEKGINDMSYGWYSENDWNKKVYQKWCSMLNRVYSEKYHDNYPTYINTTICLEWHWLSKFVEDIVYIDGYNEKDFLSGKLVLDKDIKTNGKNKEYSLTNCIFTTNKENVKQSNKTQRYTYGENHHMYNKKHTEETKAKISKNNKGKGRNFGEKNGKFKDKVVALVNNEIIGCYDSCYDAERKTGINNSNINKCCNKKSKYAGQYKNGIFFTSRKKVGDYITWMYLKQYLKTFKP